MAAIVTAATARFAEHGYRGTSMADVAADVGVSEATIFHHFATKEAVLLAALDADALQLGQRFWALLAPGGVEALRNLATWGLTAEASTPLLGLHIALATEALGPAAAERSRATTGFAVAAIAEALTVGVERGELVAGLDVEATARHVLALLDGYRLQWLQSGRAFAFDEHLGAALEQLVAAISAPG